MRIYENGKYRDMTTTELAKMEAQAAEQERQYWQTTPYDEAVDAEIRKRYTVSQEFAILRQKDEKPEEYAAYYAYCEECKAFAKAQKSKYE
jgi:hypothetical protein